MEYVFGGTLICPTAEAAQAVTFHKDIRLKSVTLDGDVYDPSGTLSGGSKPRTSGVLIRVQELQVIEKQLAEAKNTLNAIEEEWSRMKQHVERYKTAKRDLDLKNHEVKLLEQRVTESSASRVRLGCTQSDVSSKIPLHMYRSSLRSKTSSSKLLS